MGEVYRARDTRLDRTVALKIIRQSELPERDRVERFKREARAISRLSHPNICTLYDIGEHDGEAFLVMEYLEGETLASRLERGPLPIREVLRFGAQMAEALDIAHRNGVIHRDLKPSNIMFASGSVKLLDFGLAKLREPDGGRPVSDTTMTLGLSTDGTLLGSLPYMAPEQLEGKPVDERTDIFALGAVLYEMLTGEAAFQGSTQVSLIAAILSVEPVSMVTRQPQTPPLVDRTIRRCLAKAPDERWQTAADLAAELKYLGETPSAVLSSPATRRHWVRSAALVSAALIVGAGLIAIGLTVRSPVQSLPSFQRLTFHRGIITAARVAPDGQTLVYSAAWEGRPYDLYLTRIGSYESRSLGMVHGRLFGISKSNEMAFMRGRQTVFDASGTMARVPLAGGVARELLENVMAADWAPDGSSLAVARFSGTPGKVQLEFPIGSKVYESVRALVSLRVSPDGEHVALMEGTPREIAIVDRAGHKKTLSTGWWPALGLAWSADGKEIWFTGSRSGPPALRAVSLSGKERLLAESPDWLTIQDVLLDGRVLAVRDNAREGFACRTPNDTSDRDLSWFDLSVIKALSADGRTVAFGEVRGSQKVMSIYIRKTDGSAAVRLGDGAPQDLSPDGRWVVTRTVGALPTWMILPVGPGLARTLPRGDVVTRYEADFLPNGQAVAFGGQEEGREPSIYVQDLTGGLPRRISPEGVRTTGLATPDSQFVLGSSGGKHILFPVNDGQPRVLSFLSPDDSPVQWTSDGHSLFVIRVASPPGTDLQLDQTMEGQIDKVDIASGRRSPWTTVKPVDPIGLESIYAVYITPDGSSYCYGYDRTLSDLFMIEGIK